MNDVLKYLRDYLPDPELLELADIPGEVSRLPAAWVHVLSATREERVRRALDLWAPFENLVPELIGKLRERLVSVELLRYRNTYSLLYGVLSANRTLYYEARNPLSQNPPSTLGALWGRLPTSIRDFYAVHNGWFYLASHSMGPWPFEDMFVLSQEEWGILDEIEAPEVDLDNTVALYTNGMGGYLCVDLSKPEDQNALLWYSKKAPRTGLEFWSVVDAWTSMGLEAE